LLLPKAEDDSADQVFALDLFDEILSMTYVARTGQAHSDTLSDRGVTFFYCITHSYGPLYHSLFMLMLVLLMILLITLSLGFGGVFTNPSWALLCIPLWVFDFFLITFAILGFFLLFGSSMTLGSQITIGRPKFDAVARAFIPISGVLAIIFAVAFSAFTVLYELQLSAESQAKTPIGWEWVFIPLVVMWACYVVVACVSWMYLFSALLFVVELALCYLRLKNSTVETWSWFIIAIPMFIWAVYAIVAPFVFVAKRKRNYAVFTAIWTWTLVILFVCLWCAWGDDHTVLDFWVVLIPVDLYLALKLFEQFILCCGSLLRCVGFIGDSAVEKSLI